MDTTQTEATPGVQTLEAAIQDFLESGSKSGNYKSNLAYVLSGFREQVAPGATTLADVDKEVMAEYATYLRRRVDAHQTPGVEGGIAASTAWAYYDNVSAFFDYCLKWDKIDENPAQKQVAKDELPERPSTVSGSQQFWSTNERRQLLDHVDRRASTAIDDRGTEAVVELRDKALAYVLAFTGVRGGEILKDSRDDRRVGLRWADVDIEDNQITILGKNQQREPAQLPGQTHHPLKQLRRVVEPASEEWPVFVSLHAPSMYSVLPDGFERPDDDERSLIDHCRALEVVPPALSTNGARSVLKRLCRDGEIEVEGDKEFLTLHGARRGVGEKLYRERGAAAAQRTLRHADPKTTSEMYSHIETSENAENVTEVFGDER
ncbi:tyrosine-type recombinase/integrase [Halohasta litorea]|uniref:Tyrosine-type recombinase/integrase n=1 Tax=Halohasta litorea TaxID=869891 RepID=A0ABD6DB61_9EURY|nr:site-specific integrase [Halohasta litorea]